MSRWWRLPRPAALRRRRKAQALNIAHAYDSVEALLAHPGLQVVHNCTPNHLHAQINPWRILAAGLHVFSEKPLCMTAEEARELVALAARAGVVASASSTASSLWSAGGGDDPPWRGRQNLRGHGSYFTGLDAAGDRLQLAGRFGAGRRVGGRWPTSAPTGAIPCSL
ncbi:Gfo/Idh/MocA family oxidoreductase [Klebsiella pneumoniae]|nr:Gfo/Idh/MocA family oxidoreductase [Klebsiella pneumoniae]